ncbi:MAG: EAL domain-containing protein [Cyanobacteria bacterium RI_101]|nr:EAL domain-containing protein [Cyanobacteria bacterium RI_101]
MRSRLPTDPPLLTLSWLPMSSAVLSRRPQALALPNLGFLSSDPLSQDSEPQARHLRRALARGEFSLHYQPQTAANGGALEGLEVLLRWTDPRRGAISPDVFIPLAETTGFIHVLGHWVLEEACRQYRRWSRANIAPPKLSVNLSALQLTAPGWAEGVERVLAQTQMSPDCLELEITESCLVKNLAQARTALERLQKLGVRVAIDDFGVGYSSLFCLKDLPVQSLKLDKSFLKDLDRSPKNRILLQGMIDLGRRLKLKVVAEGVETWEQFHLLKSFHCDVIQGYLISRPLPLEGITQFLRRRSYALAA